MRYTCHQTFWERLSRGNRYKNKGIVQSDAMKLKKSQILKKVETLLYDFDFTGLDLSTWNVVTIHQKEFHCILQPLDGKGSGDNYDIIFGLCKNIISTHKSVRDSNWGAEGRIFPAGLHYDMFNKRIVRYPNNGVIKDPGLMEYILSDMPYAHSIFKDQFGHRGIGYNKMMKCQEEYGNEELPDYPARWMASDGLRNPEHIDDKEMRSYAVWLMNTLEKARTSTYLLFPQWKVAVQLDNGTWISWNGKKCAHCSTVPREPDGFRILSLFTSQEQKLCEFLRNKKIKGGSALK
jgi:hypothetical protein